MTNEGLSFSGYGKKLNGPKKDFLYYMLGSALYVLQAHGLAPEVGYAYLRELTFYLQGKGPVPTPPVKEEAVGKQGSGLWTPGQSEGVAPGHGGDTIWVPGGGS